MTWRFEEPTREELLTEAARYRARSKAQNAPDIESVAQILARMGIAASAGKEGE